MEKENNFQETDHNDTAEDRLLSIANTTDLSAAIQRLEQKSVLIEEDLKDHFQNIVESLKPSNILKNTLYEVQKSAPLKHNLFKIIIGLGAGYFSRKMVVGKSAGIVKKALGTALQFGITKLVAGKKEDENNEDSSSKKKNFLQRIFSI
ncbi:MAG: hypothetical protein ABI237_16840 [Ginsengibacter sp.]